MGSVIRRLGLICTHASPLAALGVGKNGGHNAYVLAVMRSLSAVGVEVHTFTQAPVDAVTEIAPGAFVHNLAIPAREAHLDELVSSAQEFTQAIQDKHLELDAWWSHYWIAGLAAEHLKTKTGKPWAHSAHTLAKVKRLTFAVEELEEREAAEAMIVARADRLIVNTPVEAAQLKELYGASEDKILLAWPGVSEDWSKNWRLRKADGPARLLFVGRLEPLKGPDIAIRAFAASGLAKRGGRLALVGGGSPNYSQELAQLTKKLGCAKEVEFKGALSTRVEMVAAYAQANCLLVTSHSESFGLVALEAQAGGCPVLASDVGGLPYAVAEGASGLLVPVGDVAAFAAALTRLWAEPGLMERLSQGGSKQAARFNWNTTTKTVLQGLEASAAPRRGKRVTKKTK